MDDPATAVGKKLTELFNKKDAAGLAALFSPTGTFIDPTGNVAKGRAEIEAAEAAAMKGWGDFTFSGVAKDSGRIGNNVWGLNDVTVNAKNANGSMTLRLHALNVLVRVGKEWKIAVASVGATVPPPGAQSAR